MTTIPQEPEGSPALAALTELYRDGMDKPTAAELDRGLDAVLARMASDAARRRGIVRWSMVGVAAALSTLVTLQVVSVRRKGPTSAEAPALTYQVDGGSVLEGGYLRESGHSGMNLRFNEGSTLALSPGTRGRIREVDRQGARMAIEQGTASFHVTHVDGRRWLVDVGPFLVTVKGTAFTVSWDPSNEQFELRMQQGRVVVNGPVSAGEIALRAGERLKVNLTRAESVITEANWEPAGDDSTNAPAPAVASVNREPPVESGPPAAMLPPAQPPSPFFPSTPNKRRWSDEMARGNWDGILAEVDRIGVEPTLNTASSDDLFSLADAARYRRRPDLARAALLAERRRFPSSPRSLDALYLLGRVEESREGSGGQAITWYNEYLARSPTGPFAGEALGRKMSLTDKLEGPARARAVAEEYLRRFPKGSYAGSARALMRVQ